MAAGSSDRRGGRFGTLDLQNAAAPPDGEATAMPSRETVELLCEPGRIRSVVQPVVRTSDSVILGYQALAPVEVEPLQPPNWWLEGAEALGLRGKLELACLAAAAALGEPPLDRMLFVNVSPSTHTQPLALRLLDTPPSTVLIEMT